MNSSGCPYRAAPPYIRRRPLTKLNRATTKKTTNRIHAMFVAVPATPENPRRAAINAITKKVTAQFNMIPP
jgi:hypothetical protein